MTVVHVSSEVVPFSKTGGLADVAGALPEALAASGLDVLVFSPHYPSIVKAGFRPEPVSSFPLSIGAATRQVGILELTRNGVRHFFVDEPHSFERAGLYGDKQGDYPDNAERFTLFASAVLSGLARTGVRPDVIHCHDWQTALIPLFLRERADCGLSASEVKTVLTIHNLGYQGNFPKARFELLRVPDRLFSPEGIEFYDNVSFLKAGIRFADKLTTVSPTYAKEILTKELGFALDGVLCSRENDLVGILNGIDTEVWNPATDRQLYRAFDAGSPQAKKENKDQLAKELGLGPGDYPLFGCVTRLAGQKGIDKIIRAIPRLIRAGAKIAILGTGEAKYEKLLKRMLTTCAGSLSATIGFSEQMAHRIYAGSDFFLMPSEYEPCGLGQMISLRYGTLPVASRTGGLADSIIDLEEHPLSGNGYLFTRGSQEEFQAKLNRAIALYQNRKAFTKAKDRAMAADFSWTARSHDYIRLYEDLCRS